MILLLSVPPYPSGQWGIYRNRDSNDRSGVSGFTTKQGNNVPAVAESILDRPPRTATDAAPN
jgi:hypothetical protein